jgi:DNA-binding CsgD family transcriptional regulator
MNRKQAPVIVLDAPTEAEMATAVRRLRDAGWRLHPGFAEVPLGLSRLVCHGAVGTGEDAGAAVLAATWGAGLLLAVHADPETRDALVEDLMRIGSVTRGLSQPGTQLTADEASLLDLLAAGLSLGQAATRLHLSRRTADRRLSAARRRLGVVTTAEALVAWRSRAVT